MGLAITMIGDYPEKVWYHKCKSSNCENRELDKNKGCCRWNNDIMVN